MMDDRHEIEEGEANTSSNDVPRRRRLTPARQALADSMMESITASVSNHRSGDPPTIYIVPQTIRQANKVAYEPKIVSIGPYHNGKENLQGMEEHKWLYLHSFLSRNTKYKLVDYLGEIEELEDEARSCYSEKVGHHMGNKFVKMMMLDGCFIVELFLKWNELKQILDMLKQKEELDQKEEEVKPKEKELMQKDTELELKEELRVFFKDTIFNTTGMVSLIGYDMLLLENQIPFSILQRIFIMAYPVNVPHLLEEMALHFFDQFMPSNKEIEIEDNSYYHLLHLFHSHLLPSKEKPKPNLSWNLKIKLKPNLSCNPKIKSVLNKYLKNLLPCSNETPLPITEPREMIPCATDLQLAGVKFKKCKKSKNILDVKFSHGVLEITPFVIDDHSDTLFRNLVAFEQCCLPPKFHFFTTYIAFMDCLVNTSKDVTLLHHNGIIDNLLGSDDDVAHLFNRLCIGIFHTFKRSYLQDVKDKLQKHYDNKCNMRCASWKRKYCTNPWSCISLIAASILLLLTITQTFYTVFAYHRPPS